MSVENEPVGNENEPVAGNETVLPFRSPVPTNFGDLVRVSGPPMTINELVEEELPTVWADPVFQKLISAIYREESVEGSLRADDQEAARMLRVAAPKDSPLKGKNLETIAHSLRVVLKRFGQSRRDRLRNFAGEIES